MRLHSLIASPGARKRKKRVGRGEGSGRGKTSGRGTKGQHARAGSSIRPGFESGHVPLYRKLPKRGFSRARFRVPFEVVNLGELVKLDADITEVDREVLVKAGLVRANENPLKILGEGPLNRALTVKADRFSASAKEKIEKAGGKVIEPEAAAETAVGASTESDEQTEH